VSAQFDAILYPTMDVLAVEALGLSLAADGRFAPWWAGLTPSERRKVVQSLESEKEHYTRLLGEINVALLRSWTLGEQCQPL
jgi:hypothetical protein